ncbi:MAG: glycine cleavage system aminomethyltransferase GcvT [Actinobacteria bacterium]|nr:glycine cleavage system aminomethyltransferase GcvT [Actinomycetota bacterium]
MTTPTSRRTALYERHIGLAAKMVEFAGWNMPLHYPGGIIHEHLATRKTAGLFDISHMGRFIIHGRRALDFLQHVLTNNAAALKPGHAQYTIIPDPTGQALDDAYLYRFVEHEYLLVVNAANSARDYDYFQSHLSAFDQVELIDQTDSLAMLSLQGPRSKEILAKAIDTGELPEPRRNSLSTVTIDGSTVLLSRTGYTGEPLCFELFVAAQDVCRIWDLLTELGSVPVGLGARDTLRLEAGLPLYGHELGPDPEGRPIPIFSCPLAKFAVSFSSLKGSFVGRDALARQYRAYKRITFADYSLRQDLPRMVFPLALSGKSVARSGAKVFSDRDKHIGFVTSGTMVPYWIDEGQALASRLTQSKAMRPICLALLDSNLRPGQTVLVEIRDKKVPAFVVPYNLRSEAPPFARAIIYDSPVQKLN